MSSSLKIISNSTKHSGYLSCSSFRSDPDAPALAERGIRNGGIAVIRAPYEMRRAGGSENRHVTLWLILEGTVRFEVPGRRFTAPPGSTLVMNSDVDRLCRVDSGIFRHIYFTLAPDATAGEAAVYPSSYASEIGSLLPMLFREILEVPGSGNECRRHLGTLLADYLQRELGCSPAPARLKHLFELLESAMETLWSTASLAKELHMSPSLLYQLCRTQCGRTPGEIVREVKFRYASELLRRTDDKIDSIAASIGYGNAFAFSKAFHKFTGKRPAEVRKRNREFESSQGPSRSAAEM